MLEDDIAVRTGGMLQLHHQAEGFTKFAVPLFDLRSGRSRPRWANFVLLDALRSSSHHHGHDAFWRRHELERVGMRWNE